MSQAARLDRMLKSASQEYLYMDNATFDLRTAALGYLAATEALDQALPYVSHIPLRLTQCEMRDALHKAFEEAGLDRALLKRLGLVL